MSSQAKTRKGALTQNDAPQPGSVPLREDKRSSVFGCSLAQENTLSPKETVIKKAFCLRGHLLQAMVFWSESTVGTHWGEDVGTLA